MDNENIRERRQQVRGWASALTDAVRNAASVAFRASEAFDGSDECVVFHKAGPALNDLLERVPELKEAAMQGLNPGKGGDPASGEIARVGRNAKGQGASDGP